MCDGVPMTEIEVPSAGDKVTPPQGAEILSEAQKIKKGICPSCDGSLVFQEGCKVCYGCGWGGCE